MPVLRREDIRFLFLETAMVLLGVLAALLVDGAREQAATRRAVEAATERLVTEVRENIDELRDLNDVVSERVARLRGIQIEREEGVSLAQVQSQFGGFRTPEFNSAAWDRLSGSGLAEQADPDLLRDAFYLYEGNAQLKSLEEEMKDLVFSEVYFLPNRTQVAIEISERIMEQQLSWARILIPEYEEFLSLYGAGS